MEQYEVKGNRSMDPFDNTGDGRYESVDGIAFLANSVNRIAVLDALTSDAHSRHVLAERLEVSRVTIARILDDLEARRWISQHGQIAEITPLGEWVAAEFESLCETMDAERKLRTIVEWFPDEGFDVPVRRLADAEITLASSANANAPIDRLVRQFDETDHVDCFSFGITGQFLTAWWRFVVERGHTCEWVFTTAVLDVLTEYETMRRQSREMLETGRATFYRYDGDIQYVVIMTDRLVNVRLANDSGAPSALIQSEDVDVRSWAESRFRGFREDGAIVDPETFAP